MRRGWMIAAIVSLIWGLGASDVLAQGGGASSTGTIQGRVADTSGAVLPGVTVTATSDSLLGVQVAVSSETGNYRFPAVPPGVYTLTYELPGFNTIRREGIQITLGFTATVNIEMALATLEETVTVTGASPVIDTTATRVVQNFKLDQLQSIPNGRDMWSLLAVTPAVQMARIDVGGNRAGTQTGFMAYGFEGQVRVLIEGINTTEGTGAAGFYFDYSSLEEVFLGTSGQSAEMPNPGVQSQFIAKSGGNRFAGEYYLDWYNNSLQGSNIPADVIARGIREGSNEIDRYYDTAINVGGPIKRDRVWWFGTYRTQFNAVAQPNFNFDQTFDTKLWNPVGKVTYQANQNNKLIGYYQWGQKVQPTRLPFAAYQYDSPEQTFAQDSGSWVWKGEWNGTISDKLYAEVRYGSFGYYFPLIANSNADFFWQDTGLGISDGAHQRWQLDRERNQATGAMTYFLDTPRGSHTIKVGGEMLREQGWEGRYQAFGGNIDHRYNNGVSNQVQFWLPTATAVGHLRAGKKGDLTARQALNHDSFFVNDTWATGRMTVNVGARYDRYHGWLPEQQQLAATTGPVSVPAATFARVDQFTWNQFAPRVGAIYDVAGDGRTVVKANYGFYWHNPGVGTGGAANPNTAAKSAAYQWNDVNGDRRWQPGEEGNQLAASLAGAIQLDPDISAPYTHEASVWVERQLADALGMRAGFVYKTEDDLISLNFQPGRPFESFTRPFEFVDIGVDGIRGTADDRVLTFYGIPTADAGSPGTAVMNVDQYSHAKTAEVSFNKRYSNRWSASIGGAYTWLTDFPNGPQRNPNNPGVEDRTLWNFKLTGSYDAAWGIRFSPVVRHQSGANYARTIAITCPGLGLVCTSAGAALNNNGSFAYAEPMNANREDNIWVFDVRAEKTLNLNARTRARLFLDLFNITNSAAAETITRATGPNYQRPAAILAPRTARLGFRFIW
jgi:hypothetical protein